MKDNTALKDDLGINDWLMLIKEDKNLNGAYISISQYIYYLEKADERLTEQFKYLLSKLDKADNQAERIEYLERSNNRREDTIAGLEQEIDDLDNDWINLNKYIDSYIGIMINNPDVIEQGQIDILYEIKDKMKEIKGGNK